MTQSTFKYKYSVLTRILPWGVPGLLLLRNRGPVRTLGGQLLQVVCYMKYLPNPIWPTSCLRFDNDAYTNLHHIGWNNKINGNKIED